MNLLQVIKETCIAHGKLYSLATDKEIEDMVLSSNARIVTDNASIDVAQKDHEWLIEYEAQQQEEHNKDMEEQFYE